MLEFLPVCSELIQFRAGSLRQDGVAGIAIVRFDAPFAIGCQMIAVVAAETARPIFMTDIVRVIGP